MKGKIQDKIDSIKKMAKASGVSNSSREFRKATSTQDSLSKAITSKKQADLFLAELEAAIKVAQAK